MNHHERILAFLAVCLLSLTAVGVAFSDDDDDDDDHGKQGKLGGWMESRADFAPVTNAAYSEECGACHMAYPPGLLPSRAWTAIMSPDGLRMSMIAHMEPPGDRDKGATC